MEVSAKAGNDMMKPLHPTNPEKKSLLERIVNSAPDIRGGAIRQLIHRLNFFEKREDGITPSNVSSALKPLQARGCLTASGDAIMYSPSWRTRQAVFNAPTTRTWTEKILKRQQKSFRSSDGAVFRFPIESSTNTDPGVLEAFITDWTPFPGAAAVAIHRSHPLAQGVHANAENYFSGTWVRHPLTGDLLPVWVCSWVRPDFGTGAVVVNPAHSSVDCEFARQVGLPMRFALADGPVTPDPATWPQPPVIKRGITTKTGAFDGLDITQAMQRYFDALSEHGWANKLTDQTLKPIKIAATAVGDPEPRPEPWLNTLLHINDSKPFEIFWPASEVEDSLLFSRLLWHELHERSLEPQVLHLWQRVDPPKIEVPDLNLAALIAGPLDQVSVIKQQTADQCRVFYEKHEELAQRPVQDTPQPLLAKAKQELMDGNYHLAFATLYGLQKQLVSIGGGVSPSYFAVAYALAGAKRPENIDLSAAWSAIP